MDCCNWEQKNVRSITAFICLKVCTKKIPWNAEDDLMVSKGLNLKQLDFQRIGGFGRLTGCLCKDGVKIRSMQVLSLLILLYTK